MNMFTARESDGQMRLPAVIASDIHLPPALRIALDDAADYARAEKSPATRRCYASDFRIFQSWCETQGLCALPAQPAAICGFLAAEAASGTKTSTLGRRLAAIKYRHKLSGFQSPTDDEKCKATMRGIRRVHGAAPVKKAAATSEKILAMAALCPSDLRGLRDRAILLLGFACAMRRSELVALDIADVEECPEGLRIIIRKSKTDQEALGVTIAVCRGSISCPVAALRAWLDAAGIHEGPLFRRIRRGNHVQPERLGAPNVSLIVKRYAAQLALDASQFSAHSLRAGWITSAAAAGKSIFRISDQSRHKSMDVLKGYVRTANLFQDHAGAGLL